MKKKIAAAALIVSMLSISAMGTLAYFTDTGVAHNVITSGKVDIVLNDKTIDEKGDIVDFPQEGIKGVMPSSKIDKIVSVTNTEESENAWVRLLVNTEFVGELDESVVSMDLNTEEWRKSDEKVSINDKEYDAYTYYKILAPNTSTEPLFENVFFAPEMDNKYQKSTLHIDVIAQAVQADNNGSTYTEIKSWTETPVPAE